MLARKTGLPIALSVVYLEVARRAGLTLVGVSFPAHFLVATPGPGERLVLDPYNHAACSPRRWQRGSWPASRRRSASPPGSSPRSSVQTISHRMSQVNLSRGYLAQGDGERALNVVDLLLMLAPDHPGELRMRAGILSALGAYQAALVDVERCLELSPDAPDQRHLRLAARTLKQRVDYLN